MAKAWKDVIASPQYQALAPEQKAQAQEQYFNEVVAPQAGENAEQAKKLSMLPIHCHLCSQRRHNNQKHSNNHSKVDLCLILVKP